MELTISMSGDEKVLMVRPARTRIKVLNLTTSEMNQEATAKEAPAPQA